MSKYEPVTFADVKVGDTIKSVSPCGTVRVGVVASLNATHAYAYDAAHIAIAWPDDTLYRRAPKPAKFVPQDVPEVGQWIRAVLARGSAQEFLVVGVEEGTSSWFVESADERYHIDKDAQPCMAPEHIDSWRPIDPPAPAEPVKTANAIATVTVRLDLAGLADDLQAAADAVRARLENGLHS